MGVMPDFSIVVCTFNPQPVAFGRCLRAIQAVIQAAPGSCECILVDNNSSPAIDSHNYVQDFLRVNSRARVVREARQGLSHARLRGLVESRAETIVYFDDDNEPDVSYLSELATAIQAHPQVGVWGPGVVAVEFLGDVPDWVETSCRHMFQERRSEFTEYACLRVPWISSYPAGTGQSVRRDVMERYAARVAEGSCTATDRSGNSLASAGDGQIVHTAVLMGLAAGVCPSMRVRHLIPAERCTSAYLSRLCYGVSSSLLPATAESFPEIIRRPEYRPPSWARYHGQKWIAWIRECLTTCRPLRRVLSAARVGDAIGRYAAAGRPVPRWLDSERVRAINS
jgi:glycosyltransferase involved in cell wall biosynthesis